MADEAPKQTPLYDRHVALGARMVEFGGWAMPVQYDGIVSEHRRCREAAGLFDVSHMGEFVLEGGDALEFLQRALTNDFSSLAPGRCRYSLMCNEAGGVVDDLIVYRQAEQRYLIVVNAGNIDQDFSWLQSLGCRGGTLTNVSDAWALLAVQGPRSREILSGMLSAEDAARLAALKYYAFDAFQLCGIEVTISRTGYTGGLGYEIFVPSADAGTVWDALLIAGEPAGMVPVGLGARDTLRLEAGFCLHGHDISLAHNPVEAGLERFVKLNKPEFVGRGALADLVANPPARKLCGLTVVDRGVIRDGCAVRSNGETVGMVTSGTFSPLLEHSIALAYVRADLSKVGTQLGVEVRGRELACAVAALPFYQAPA